jgi:hypothetical protein
LNDNPLSELADGEGNVINNAKLSVADAKVKLENSNGKNQDEGMVSVYPNPVTNNLNIEYIMEQDGLFSAELLTLQGVVVQKSNPLNSKTGFNKTMIRIHEIPNGAYLLKVNIGNTRETTKVIVNR